jgi:hypothetical protein
LEQIFHKNDSKPFAGLPMICTGDFLQLPPVGDKWIFNKFTRRNGNIVNTLLLINGRPISRSQLQQKNAIIRHYMILNSLISVIAVVDWFPLPLLCYTLYNGRRNVLCHCSPKLIIIKVACCCSSDMWEKYVVVRFLSPRKTALLIFQVLGNIVGYTYVVLWWFVIHLPAPLT